MFPSTVQCRIGLRPARRIGLHRAVNPLEAARAVCNRLMFPETMNGRVRLLHHAEVREPATGAHWFVMFVASRYRYRLMVSTNQSPTELQPERLLAQIRRLELLPSGLLPFVGGFRLGRCPVARVSTSMLSVPVPFLLVPATCGWRWLYRDVGQGPTIVWPVSVAMNQLETGSPRRLRQGRGFVYRGCLWHFGGQMMAMLYSRPSTWLIVVVDPEPLDAPFDVPTVLLRGFPQLRAFLPADDIVTSR